MVSYFFPDLYKIFVRWSNLKVLNIIMWVFLVGLNLFDFQKHFVIGDLKIV